MYGCKPSYLSARLFVTEVWQYVGFWEYNVGGGFNISVAKESEVGEGGRGGVGGS